jgi:hypothetical protein
MRSHSQHFEVAGTPYLSYPTLKKRNKMKTGEKKEKKRSG